MNLQKVRAEILCAGVIGVASTVTLGVWAVVIANTFSIDVASEDVYAAFFLGGVLWSFLCGD